MGLIISSWGTPDRSVAVTERIIGANATGFAILRTESDNRGSYYIVEEKRYLDVYEKVNEDPDGVLAKRTASTLLLDTSITTIDGLSKSVNARDATVLLADLLQTYPNSPVAWSADQFSKLESDPTGGIEVNSKSVVWGGSIKEFFRRGRNDDLGWRLDEVMQDENCLFLKVSAYLVDDAREQYWVCLSPERTRFVKAHLERQELYISAGSFASKEEALEKAKGFSGMKSRFSPEVWTIKKAAGEVGYLLVDTNSTENLRKGRFAAMEEALGVDLEIIPSKRFENLIPVE